MRVLLGALLLYFACLFWLVENAARRALGLETQDNCFTWAWRHFRYFEGDKLLVGKSVSGWFPHIAVVTRNETCMTVTEYVPIERVDQSSPPSKFSGRVVTRRYLAE